MIYLANRARNMSKSSLGLLLAAFLFPILLCYWQFVDANNGWDLLSPYVQSDTALFHYSAWFKATLSANSYVSDIIVLSPYEALLSETIEWFGFSNVTPFALNALLHASTSLCVVITTWVMFDKRTAFIAFLLYGLCAPLLYFAGTTSKSNLVILLISVCNLFAVLFFRYRSIWLAVAFVAILMLCVIERVHIFVALFVFVVILLLNLRLSPFKPAYSKALVSVFIIVGVLMTISTYKFGAEPKYFSSIGLNIYLGHTKPDNHKLRLDGVRNHLIGHRVDSRAFAEKQLGMPLTQSAVTWFWLSKTWDYIKNNPRQYIKAQSQKAQHLFAKVSFSFRTEMVNLWRDQRQPLKYAVIDFGSLFALFVAGCVYIGRSKFVDKQAIDHATLYVVSSGVLYLGSIMLTIVSERYRLGALIFMFPVAAYAVNQVRLNLAKNSPYLLLIVAVFSLSYWLMETAPAGYNEPQIIEIAQKSESKLLSGNVMHFYKARQQLDKNGINRDDCRVLIAHLKKIRFHWDVKRVKEYCLYKREPSHNNTE